MSCFSSSSSKLRDPYGQKTQLSSEESEECADSRMRKFRSSALSMTFGDAADGKAQLASRSLEYSLSIE